MKYPTRGTSIGYFVAAQSSEFHAFGHPFRNRFAILSRFYRRAPGGTGDFTGVVEGRPHVIRDSLARVRPLAPDRARTPRVAAGRAARLGRSTRLPAASDREGRPQVRCAARRRDRGAVTSSNAGSRTRGARCKAAAVRTAHGDRLVESPFAQQQRANSKPGPVMGVKQLPQSAGRSQSSRPSERHKIRKVGTRASPAAGVAPPFQIEAPPLPIKESDGAGALPGPSIGGCTHHFLTELVQWVAHLFAPRHRGLEERHPSRRQHDDRVGAWMQSLRLPRGRHQRVVALDGQDTRQIEAGALESRVEPELRRVRGLSARVRRRRHRE